LVKPAPLENFSRSTYNNNLDLIDAAMLKLPITIGVPAGKTPKILPINIVLTTGAGGDVKGTASATDANGYGGFWFADVPITFEAVLSVQMTGFHAIDGFLHAMTILDFNTTRVKFKAWRLSTNGPANGYGSINFNAVIFGY
jgi:hypothetical protein